MTPTEEVQGWLKVFQLDFHDESSDSLPTEDNALRQLIYGAIAQFIEDTHVVLNDHENVILAWVDRTYGPMDEKP